MLAMQSYYPAWGKKYQTMITGKALKNNGSLNRRCGDCKNSKAYPKLVQIIGI
jgi:hypothetical protein